jgi:3-methyladenine DNA glycosylase AlkC
MAELMRDAVNRKSIGELGERIYCIYPEFDRKAFEKSATDQLDELSLTGRLDLVASALKERLPENFPQAAQILVESLGDELDDQGDDPVTSDYSSSQGFLVMSLCSYIAANGKDHFDISMNALNEMTRRFSAEGPIREFLIHDETRTLALYENWASDPNVHVRRLVSESTRPRLPWARQLTQFIQNPQPVLQLLEMLKNDNHLYVRRSVANNLNDISKDNPEIVKETLTRWKKEDTPQMVWLIKHALRTLIKKGDSGALALVGVSSDFLVDVDVFSLSDNKVLFGGNLELHLQLSTTQESPQDLLIDYIVFHKKANGKLTPKVFKWTKKTISKKSPLVLSKRHPIREISTRRYYEGGHEVHIQINGKVVAHENFELLMKSQV